MPVKIPGPSADVALVKETHERTTQVNGWLVAYEYGSGAAWGFVRASSHDEIHRAAPEVVVHSEAPSWMSTAELTCLREQSVDVHELNADRLFQVSMEVGAALAR